jgi:amino acid transporter
MTDYDATAHITEEMRNPAVKAPVSILSALGVAYVMGFCLNIALAYATGPNWPDLLLSPTGLPVAQILYNVMGNKGGVVFMALAAAICNFTGASCLQAQARTLFALSRGNVTHDRG